MDEELIRYSQAKDVEFRSAVCWWIRLHNGGSDPDALRNLATWLAESAKHRRAFARVEALWQTVQLALCL